MKPTLLPFSPIFSIHFDHHKSFLCDHVNSRSHDPSLRITSPSLTPNHMTPASGLLHPASPETLPLLRKLAYSPFPLHDPLLPISQPSLYSRLFTVPTPQPTPTISQPPLYSRLLTVPTPQPTPIISHLPHTFAYL